MAYSQDDIDRLEKYIELQQKASKNLKSYAEVYEVIHELKRTAQHLDDQAEKIEKKRLKVEKELLDIKNNQHKLTGKELAERKKYLTVEKKRHEDNLDLAKKNSAEAKVLAGHMAENLNTMTLVKAAWGSTLDLAGNVTKTILDQNKYLFDQQKSVKMAGLQMGILSREALGFRDNIYKASLSTNQLGIGAKELGEMQATYSSEMGRTVALTEAGLEAMAELATGTILGQENAARFAANMDNFGYSVERSRDFMEETLDIAHTMGLNAAEATKNTEQALKYAQKYNFREGVKGVSKMALMATKFKIEMESIAGMAESVFNPEGAVEMAAQLSVLGGAWSQLGDPFQLMFKARNDMAGFTEDIVKAAAGTAQFNKETGEFDIPAMELHRLREVAKATGMSIDELTKSARESAKFSEIKSNVTGNFDDEVMDFIAAKGVWNDAAKEFEVSINGKNYFVDELHNFTNNELSRIAKEKASLNERAKQAQTFDEMYDNVINQFKSTLLPGFERFTDALLQGLVSFSDFLLEEGVLDGIADFGKFVGEWGATIVKFIAKNPLAAGALLLLGKSAMWFSRGVMLGKGFNMATRGLTGGGAKGIGKTVMGTGTGGGKFGKIARGVGRGGGALAALGLGMDGISNGNDDSLSAGEAVGKTIDQNKFMLAGAIIGSVVPVIGTAIGAGIGGLVDHFVVPALSEDGNRTSFSDTWGSGNRENQDFVSRPGQDPIPFSSADTLIGMKKGGGIDNHLSKKKNTSSGIVNVNFTKALRVEGTLNLISGNKNASINLDDPMLIRELSRLVQERLSTELNGSPTQTPTS